MANENNVNTRIQHKHDIEANWLKSVYVDGIRGEDNLKTKPFIPRAGELIIYDPDDENYSYVRFKIGDGIKNVDELDFVNKEIVDRLTAVEETAEALSEKTIDKIAYIDHWYGPTSMSNLQIEDIDDDEDGGGRHGIIWTEDFGLLNNNDNCIVQGNAYHRIPIAAGKNVSFEITEHQRNNLVRINASIDSMGLTFEPYTTDDGTVVGYTCTGMGTCIDLNLRIPSTYQGLPVVAIGTDAFKQSNIISVNIPEGVKYINANAFFKCLSLLRVNLPESLIELAAACFQGCVALTKIIIPDNVTSIGRNAFNGCTDLKDLTIGSSVETISGYAFQNCKNLTKIHFKAIRMTNLGKKNYVFQSGGTEGSGIDVLIDRKVKAIPANIFRPNSDNLSLDPKIVSVRFEDNSECTIIDQQAFAQHPEITSLILPHGLTEIGSNAFRDCSGLKVVKIPDTVTTMGIYAFQGCTALEDVTLPDSIKTIGSSAFRDCPNLTHVELPKDLTVITENLFEMTIPDDNPDLVIENSIESVVIPKSVVEIQAEAFLNCVKLKDIYYTGSEDEWNAITINSTVDDPNKDIDFLPTATIHYNFNNDFRSVHEKLNSIMNQMVTLNYDSTTQTLRLSTT